MPRNNGSILPEFITVVILGVLAYAISFLFPDVDDDLRLAFAGVVAIVGWVVWHYVISPRFRLFIQRLVQKKPAYRDLLRQSRKRPADINLKLQSVSFGWGCWRSSMPIGPLRFRIYLDIQNTGNEPGKLKSVSVRQFEMGTSLLGSQPTKLSWHRESDDRYRASSEIVFPCLIEPGEWNIRVRCDLQVELCETDPMKLAKRLCELDEFLIELHYEYEEFDGTYRQKTLPIQDTFIGFRKRIIRQWISHNSHELVYAAVDIESLLDDGP